MVRVRARGPGTWQIRFSIGKRRFEPTVVARTKSEAQRLGEDMERREQRVVLGLEDAPSVITIGQTFERYYPTTRALRSHETVGLRFRKWILPKLKDVVLHRLTPADVDRHLGWCMEQGLKPQSVKHIRNHLSALYTFAIDRERVFRGPNPVRQSQLIDIPDRKPKYIDGESVQRVIDAAPDYYRGIIATGFYTGLRRSELWSLRPDDVDFRRGFLRIVSPKTGKFREVVIHDQLAPYLRQALADARSEWLFPTREGKQLGPGSQLNDRLAIAVKRAGLIEGFNVSCRRKGCGFKERRATGEASKCPRCDFALTVSAVPVKFTFKDMRSTLGTLLYEATGDIRLVQRTLGHSDPRLTERVYAGNRAEHMVAQHNRLSFGVPGQTQTADETSRISPIQTKPAQHKAEQNQGGTT